MATNKPQAFDTDEKRYTNEREALANEERDIARAEVALLSKQLAEATAARGEALAASGALVEALACWGVHDAGCPGKSEGPDYCTCGLSAALSNPTEAGKARDARLVAEERSALYGGLAMAFGMDALDSVGSSVVEKIRAKVRAAALEEAAKEVEDDWWPPTKPDGCCLACGRWTPARHPERHDHLDRCPAWAEFVARRDKPARIRALSPPAPSEPECATCGGLPWVVEPGRNAPAACPDCAPSAKPSGGDHG